ncbi:MAG: head-tail connector protein [Alphaproteobacteria bacterium]
MPLILTAGPSVEPLSLDEAKTHCRIDTNTEDTLVSSLVLAARLYMEHNLGLALIRQSWSLYLDAWPEKTYVELPLSPLIDIDAIRVYGQSGTYTTIDPGQFYIDTISRRPRLVREEGQSWPVPGRNANAVEIAFTAGYGETADDVPMPIRQAIQLLIAHWYEEREPIVFGHDANTMPLTVASLIQPYQAVKL